MTVTLPKVRVGDPICHEALSVFPLFTDTNGDVEYRLSPDALAGRGGTTLARCEVRLEGDAVDSRPADGGCGLAADAVVVAAVPASVTRRWCCSSSSRTRASCISSGWWF